MPKHQHIEVCGRESIGSKLARTLARLWVTLLLGAALWVLIGILETAATRQWVGPVVDSNLKTGVDAGALFYTEVDHALIRSDVAGDAAVSAGGAYR